jgi:predicted flap endonuclease-1-like 5' DNA nuclease
MDSNTLLVIVVDGGLLLFFLFAASRKYQGKKAEKKIAVKPETILAPEPKPKPEPEPVPIPIPEPEPEPEPEPSTPTQRRIRIIDIEGIGPVYSEKLNEYGIRYIDELLEAGGTRKGREDIADGTDISPKLILEWINLADLYRIKGIGEEWSDLLEEAGVDTVPELAQRNPVNLHSTLMDINESKNLVRRTPSLEMVEDWIEQAKSLPRMIEY